MRYTHRFRVNAPLDQVRDFHSRSASMGAITPPPVIVQVHHAPERLAENDQMDFTMWLGPLPIRWLARIEDVTDAGFVDRQLSGPFAEWVHRHTFVAIDAQTTEVHDEINAKPADGLVGKLLGLGMWANMPVLFAYRQWKTRRILGRVQPMVAGN